MGKRFEDKVALVVGGTSGIGLSTARAFVAEGARVMIAGRRVAEGEAAVESIREAGGTAAYVAADVTSAESVQAMVRRTVEIFGSLHVAYNNAGITGTVNLFVEDAELSMFEQVMAINVTGTWLAMKYQVPAILASGGGAIVNCGSVAALRGSPGCSAYYGSKHAVLGMTKCVALENAARGIRVNAVCPGLVMTDLVEAGFATAQEKLALLTSRIPMQRPGQPDEVAQAVLWLASDDAAYVNGVALPVDGGISI
ncbi:glucose 1-dehydrogenase [Sandaracinobacter sp. RS1-74]|uniref:SDR family NAD(P)-dependent oxidoreductase n=1 Tax=Sandaracinobacteroides sayramensis TaxID=2913411 RepID=UPI001ED9FF42|nr:glucose 1-dehydrogenase [Sandaracinobacteroides sayramensis]MCG2840946.1 glucose 1-dehydrogenase [Sandaracinobacteroides sayramensis]